MKKINHIHRTRNLMNYVKICLGKGNIWEERSWIIFPFVMDMHCIEK